MRPNPTADMNALDCEKIGVKEGDKIEISTERGAITVKVNRL